MSRNQKAPLLVFVLVAMICTLVVVDSMRVDAGDRDLVLGAKPPAAGSVGPGPAAAGSPAASGERDDGRVGPGTELPGDTGDTGGTGGSPADLEVAPGVGGSVPTGPAAPGSTPSPDEGSEGRQLGTGHAPLLGWGTTPSDDESDAPSGDGTPLPEGSGPPVQGPSTHEGLEPEHGTRPDLPGRGLTSVSPPVLVPVPAPEVPDPTSPVPPPPATPLTPGAQPPPAEPLCRERARRHPARRALQPCR